MIELNGNIERITFYNEETYYTVAKLKLDNGEIVAIVGNLPQLYIGEGLLVRGEWIQHKDYGQQFQIAEWESRVPQTRLGIERFLGSGLIKGVGPSTAQKLVMKFGLETLTVIENYYDKLTELPGISLAKAERISQGLKEHHEIQRMMVFLQGVGVTPAYALKIYRKYKHEAIKIVRENPYRLADEVFGIGFKIADQIAQKLGISNDSPYRVRAGIRYWLNENSSDGHVYALEEEFFAKAAQELGVAKEQIATEIAGLIAEKEIFRERISEASILYLAPFYYSEIGVAHKVRDLAWAEVDRLLIKPDQELENFTAATEIKLAEKQREAVIQAVENGILVITGGPGTGKTTIVKAILHMFKAAQQKVLLAAPTGRAAKRLSESTGQPAKTIHRLLGYGNEEEGGGQFQYNEDEPLKADVVIIDEFSMVDLLLFYHLLKAIAPGTRLIIVGDVDQLPSVGAGSVLRDLINSEKVPTVRLNVIFRQAQESLIVANAHRINEGQFPVLTTTQDFFFIKYEEPEEILKMLPELVRTRLPKYLGCDPVEDIQLLAPMRRTITGVDNLNLCLQEALNPPQADKVELKTGYNTFRVGDKVMQIRNEYQKLVFNGDIGRIREIDPEERKLKVAYPEVEGEREVVYEADELDQLVLSYAISVHKSQGNEYPVVVMPVTTQHYLMLQRNLLYTAVTRAKKMVVLLGTKKALAIAVKNNRIEERNSLLSVRLQAVL